ncbi:MAG: PD40 domain-containing protein, partial [Flavobacteriales bacterium]|nr:PD40 domain-containing protein [Flavobacteriales bacterium]
MKKSTLSFLITLLTVGGVLAQDALLFEIPFKLPTEVNSEAEEAAVFVSPDGGTLYFSRIMYGGNTGGVKGGQDIWTSSSDEKGGWYLAEHNLLTLNNKGNNGVIGVSEDGSMIYLLNKYVGKKTQFGVSYATKEGEGWSEPTTLAIPGLIANSNFYGFNMDPSGMFLVISMNSRGTLGQEDLYVSKNEDGTWTSPIHLGNVINTEGYEITPYLTADTKSLYFSTDSRDGYGNADIYKAERLDDTWTNWSEPVNMGENINSAGFDAFFSISPDNHIYFCSNRSGMLSDIFQSKVLEHLVLEENEESSGLTALVVQNDPVAVEDPVEEVAEVVEESAEEAPVLEIPNLDVAEVEESTEGDAMLDAAVAEALGEPDVSTEAPAEVETEAENEVAVEENSQPEEPFEPVDEVQS